ncbi:CLUMA_CG017260, isoform A [Clunio marinus]|uniref:CLUMA_CG017260, isoform A n=1 Tax=Clunio marinus TaxID=568069 RepID=A0A1J1IVB4_9DIPT|nr:CLUMA_CG017260, isoform A [Clunio marinus]
MFALNETPSMTIRTFVVPSSTVASGLSSSKLMLPLLQWLIANTSICMVAKENTREHCVTI